MSGRAVVQMTHAELRKVIDGALGSVPVPDTGIDKGYCMSLYQVIKAEFADVTTEVEAYVRGKDLIVEARHGAAIETVMFPGVA